MIGFWLAGAALISFFITWLSGFVLIPFLHKLKYGQPIKEIGPTWHKSKQGTPTMGGILFMLGIIVSVVLVMIGTHGANDSFNGTLQAFTLNVKLYSGLLMAICFGFVGYMDDYIKVKKKHNTGLTEVQKLVVQFLIAALYLVMLAMLGAGTTWLWIPFAGEVELGWAYYPIMAIFIVGTVNAVNINDGVDGLCSSVTLVGGICYVLMFALGKIFGGAVLAMTLIGGCAGFLMHNHYPAKIIMGDIGSHFLGGLVVALAFYSQKPILLLLIGFIYYGEMLSVVLQVISFKTRKKRLFKMSPIHHHYELCGWSEKKIVRVFSFVTALCCIAAYLLYIFG